MNSIDALKKVLPPDRLAFDVPMSQHTTFRIGGKADAVFFPRDTQEIILALSTCKQLGIPVTVIGNGSNLLVLDGGIRGLVIKIASQMAAFHIDSTTITAQGGARLTTLSAAAVDAGLKGLAFAGGIPGTLGGGICMNAGAYGGELKDCVTQVEYLDPVHLTVGTKQTTTEDFGYRRSSFSDAGWIVTGATLELSLDVDHTEQSVYQSFLERRRAKQPLQYPSAGSVFKRPEGQFAGALIEQAGLKGCSVGGAQVSTLHAGFIVNIGNAKAADVLRLIEMIQQKVKQQTGILLEPEIRVVGESEADNS